MTDIQALMLCDPVLTRYLVNAGVWA